MESPVNVYGAAKHLRQISLERAARRVRTTIAALGVVGCPAEWAKPRRLRGALTG